MATNKPRITITLTDDQYRVLKSISDTSKQPMSGFISELLEAAHPTLERMAVAFQAIKAAQDAQRQKMIDDLDVAQAAIEPVVQQVTGQFDMFMAQVEKAAGVRAGDVRQRVPARAPAARPAPSTNRGATPSPTKPRKATSGAASKPVKTKAVLKKTKGKKA